jgi:hypothetical protein
MPNITTFNVSDVALYFQALVALDTPVMPTVVAAEEIRKRAVTYLERRRAIFSLPPLRGQLETLGEKILLDLRQMNLATIVDTKIKLTSAGLAIVNDLKRGEGRHARLAILGCLVGTYDNAAILCATVTPPTGKNLFLPMPRATTEDGEDDENESRLVPANLDSICTAWTEWCSENNRPDLLPDNFQQRMEKLVEASKDKGSFVDKARNALMQLVIDSATNGRIAKIPIYRTIRDRLSTAGGINTVTRPIPDKPLSVEVVFSCMHIGKPKICEEEWQPLAQFTLMDETWIHEADPSVLELSVLASMRHARDTLRERAGYYRIYEIRDRVCESLRLSQGMFDSVFVYIYRTRPGLMTLGVDYEKITAKRLPIEIRDGNTSNLFNLVAFKND